MIRGCPGRGYFGATSGVLAAPASVATGSPVNATAIVTSSDRSVAQDPYTHPASHDFLRDFPARTENGELNVVVEIPAGTNGKWEVEKATGKLKWEFRDGKPRIVNYLGYPGNYGMVPRTLLPKELGGDGDPLDVLILGPAVPRGTVLPTRPIAVLKMLDGGEVDDKIIAVASEGPFAKVTTLKALTENYPGVTEIGERWFQNYKGPGKVVTKGYQDETAAGTVINAAIAAYENAPQKSTE